MQDYGLPSFGILKFLLSDLKKAVSSSSLQEAPGKILEFLSVVKTNIKSSASQRSTPSSRRSSISPQTSRPRSSRSTRREFQESNTASSASIQSWQNRHQEFYAPSVDSAGPAVPPDATFKQRVRSWPDISIASRSSASKYGKNFYNSSRKLQKSASLPSMKVKVDKEIDNKSREAIEKVAKSTGTSIFFQKGSAEHFSGVEGNNDAPLVVKEKDGKWFVADKEIGEKESMYYGSDKDNLEGAIKAEINRRNISNLNFDL